jgi:hypothetical protein
MLSDQTVADEQPNRSRTPNLTPTFPSEEDRDLVRLLEGSQALQAFRSTAWGEQVIIYVDPRHPANPGPIPGVSQSPDGATERVRA